MRGGGQEEHFEREIEDIGVGAKEREKYGEEGGQKREREIWGGRAKYEGGQGRDWV